MKIKTDNGSAPAKLLQPLSLEEIAKQWVSTTLMLLRYKKLQEEVKNGKHN